MSALHPDKAAYIEAYAQRMARLLGREQGRWRRQPRVAAAGTAASEVRADHDPERPDRDGSVIRWKLGWARKPSYWTSERVVREPIPDEKFPIWLRDRPELVLTVLAHDEPDGSTPAPSTRFRAWRFGGTTSICTPASSADGQRIVYADCGSPDHDDSASITLGLLGEFLVRCPHLKADLSSSAWVDGTR